MSEGQSAIYRRLLAVLDTAPGNSPMARHALLAAAPAAAASTTPAQPPDSAAGWALLALRVAGLVTQPARGQYVLSASGRRLLGDPLVPETFGLAYLAARYPALKAWRYPSSVPAGGQRLHRPRADPQVADEDRFDPLVFTPPLEPSAALSDFSPEERLEAAWWEHRAALADDLLSRLRAVSPARFEVLVVELLVRMGYGGARPGAGVVLGGSHDGGVDGVIHEDPLGLEAVYLQAKRQAAAVGRPEIQAFAGALAGRKARKGVFLTTGAFTRAARTYAEGVVARIVLLDGPEIVALMLEHGVGLTVHKSFTIHAIDPACFAPVESPATPARRS